MSGQWVVPDNPPTSFSDVVISVPDDAEWFAAFVGAVLLLAECENWEQRAGSVSACDAAEVFDLVLLDLLGRRSCP